jgi:formylglycine-generating enzyme required for sulfatase activity
MRTPTRMAILGVAVSFFALAVSACSGNDNNKGAGEPGTSEGAIEETVANDIDVFFPAGSSNRDWTPVIHEFDGVEMVLVPAGCFMMGSNDGNPDERPVHEVCFSEPFWLDRYEVSQGQFEPMPATTISVRYTL